MTKLKLTIKIFKLDSQFKIGWKYPGETSWNNVMKNNKDPLIFSTLQEAQEHIEKYWEREKLLNFSNWEMLDD